MAKFLIDARARIDYARPDILSTALHEAVSQKMAGTIKDLLAAGANVNAATKFGETPIFKDTATIKLLIASGADVNARSTYGETPIFRVCDNAEMARILVAAKADLKVKSKQGTRPLSPWRGSGKTRMCSRPCSTEGPTRARGTTLTRRPTISRFPARRLPPCSIC
jgi:ankyrin repeat protein